MFILLLHINSECSLKIKCIKDKMCTIIIANILLKVSIAFVSYL